MSETSSGEMRRERRYTCLAPTLPGRLVSTHMQSVVRAEAVDVSASGLGITSQVEIPTGSDVWLVLKDRTIKLEVRYCATLSRSPSKFRCGLESKVPWESLRDIFIGSGCHLAMQ